MTGSDKTLEILLFSQIREIIGTRSVQMELSKPEPVRVVLDRLVAEYPAMGPYRSSIRSAVNQEYVDDAYTVFNGDELAIITPVSGG